MTNNPYESPLTVSQGPSGVLEATPEGWLQYRGNRTKEDWVALFQYSASHGPTSRTYRSQRTWIPVLVSLIGIAMTLLVQSYFVLLLSCTLALVLWFRYPAMIRASMRRAAENLARSGRNLAAFGEQCVILTPTEVRTRNAYTWSGIVWQAIESLERTDDYLFIFLSTSAAIPIRLRDFPDDASRETFVEAAFRYFHAREQDAVTADLVNRAP